MFGAKTTATPLFGTTTPKPTPPMFGTTAPAPSTPNLFAAKTTASTTPLFGSTTTTTVPTILGVTPATPLPTTTTVSSLFGSTTAAATTAPAPSLFGAATTTTATPSFFGATTAAAPATTGLSLFGTTSLTQPPAQASTAPQFPLGLGGTAQTTGTSTLSGSGTVAGTTSAEQENIKEGEVPKQFVELVEAIKKKLKENKDFADEFAASSTDNAVRVRDRLKDVQHKISECGTAAAESERQVLALSERSSKDLRLGDVAARVQDSTGKNLHHSAHAQTVSHIVEMIREYDAAVTRYQDILQNLNQKLSEVQSGKSSMDPSDLKEHLSRFDAAFSTVANQLFIANQKVDDLKAALAADGSFVGVRDPFVRRMDATAFSQLRGSDAFPSVSTLVQIGSLLRPAQPVAATTGTGFFGSTGATGTSLFGSSTAAKPFSFTNPTTSTTTSLFPATTATTTPSLFPLAAAPAKQATPAFGSTFSNHSSGVLFSSKK